VISPIGMRRLEQCSSPLNKAVMRIVAWCATCYNLCVIKSFQHKGLQRFFERGTKAGIQFKHVKRLRLQLAALDTALTIDDIDIPGYRLHSLKGRAKNRWSIWVSGNWRLTFEFKNGDVYILNYEDYH
jgi:proteic killer suppression protein